MNRMVAKRQQSPFSSVMKMKGMKMKWSDRMAVKSRKQQLKEAVDERKAAKALIQQEKRKRQEENARRKAENAKKAEITQLVKNPAKLKRMKKKALKKQKPTRK